MDELFARKLGNAEVTPPEDGWARIENELNRRSRMTRKYWLAAASFALVLSVTASMVYIQTNGTTNRTTTESVRENTSELLTEEPSTVNNNTAFRQDESRFVAQQNERNVSQRQNVNSISVSPEEATTNVPVVSQKDGTVLDVRTDMNSNPSIPAYIDSWDELLQVKPLKVDRRKIMSNKIAQLKLEMPEKKTDETLLTASTSLPLYNDIVYVDFPDLYTKSRLSRRWEITGQFAPVHSYRLITSVPNGIRKSDFDDAESPLLAYSGGINVSYKMFSRWSVQAGVFYSQMGQSINNVIPVTYMYAAVSSNSSYTKNFVRTSSGSATVASNLKSDANTTYASYFNAETPSTAANSATNISSPAKYRLFERFDYIEIPLMLRYKMIDGKLNLYVSGGMSTNILVNNNVFVDNGSETVKGGTILMARPINYSSMMGLGFGYQINRNLSVEFEPLFKYFLQSYTTSSQISGNPYAFSLFTGVVYRF